MSAVALTERFAQTMALYTTQARGAAHSIIEAALKEGEKAGKEAMALRMKQKIMARPKEQQGLLLEVLREALEGQGCVVPLPLLSRIVNAFPKGDRR